MKQTFIYSLENMSEIVLFLKKNMLYKRIFAIKGSLGAGKTTLIRLLLQSCGITGVISSPTFTYVNIYKTAKGQTIYHFDLYRISSLQDFIDAGFDEYLNDEHAYCFIEWPEIIESLLERKDVCVIDVDYVSDEKRSLTIKEHDDLLISF